MASSEGDDECSVFMKRPTNRTEKHVLCSRQELLGLFAARKWPESWHKPARATHLQQIHGEAPLKLGTHVGRFGCHLVPRKGEALDPPGKSIHCDYDRVMMLARTSRQSYASWSCNPIKSGVRLGR